jgi:hypothetical protein
MIINMYKKHIITIIVSLFTFISLSQEPDYFNNIYTYNGNYTIGMTIIDNGESYFGYGATDDVGIYQMLFLYKLSYSGEMQILKTYYEPNYTFYPGIVGGAMIETWDNKFALAYHYSQNGSSFGALMKLDYNLDTIWKKSYTPSYITATLNCIESSDKGYLLTGWVFQSDEDFSDALLLKTDSSGNYQWHQLFGGNWAEHGTNVIETPDGGYLLGGYFWKPGYDHSMDAMLIKTDSLGNEEWTHYYGNPDVDDDMALVTLVDDGNYLVATVYGEYIIAPEARTGRIYLIKVNNEGNTIWEKIIGPKMMDSHIKNLRPTNDGNLIATGFFLDDTTSDYIYKGFIYKFSQEGDSLWMRDYNHFNNPYDWNMFYDACPTSDNGYIAIGKARPDMGGNNNMWIVKTDSLGCDTPGCFTTVISEAWILKEKGNLRVWPNPANGKFSVQCLPAGQAGSEFWVGGTKMIRVYNSQGLKVEEIIIPEPDETISLKVESWPKGMYFLQLIVSGKVIANQKVIIH